MEGLRVGKGVGKGEERGRVEGGEYWIKGSEREGKG